MAELLIRAGAPDAALIESILAGPAERRPARLVVDAHAARLEPALAAAARKAGTPFLVDPQTMFWQDYQHGQDPWAQLPFADAAVLTPADLLSKSRREVLVAETLSYQVAQGASGLIAPYVHIETAGDGWLGVQLALWRETRAFCDRVGLRLPITAVMALSWRLVDRSTWPGALNQLAAQVVSLGPHEVALAASKIDQGRRMAERVGSLASAIEQVSRQVPVIAWQQGILGELAVAAGAAGYETGMGWREHCDLRAAMATRRKPSSGGPPGRPIYITAVRRGLPRLTVATLLASPRSAAMISCLDPACCPRGRASLFSDAPRHAVTSRVASLRALDQAERASWRWNHLAETARRGLGAGGSVNAAAARAGVKGFDLAPLEAMLEVADQRRHQRRPIHAA